MSAECRQCGGTGRVRINRSALIADGRYSIRCWLCGGSGESSEQPDRDFASTQKRLRESEGECASGR
jgi:DnaJ-class molecular chaperone